MGEFDIPRLDEKKSPAIPVFHVEPVQLEFASAQAGRPVFEDREFVDILIPGDRRALVHEPVNDEHRRRWPKEYEAFKQGREAAREGTPLSAWPSAQMTRARVEELAYFNIKTVEELAGVSDIQLQNLGMGSLQQREAARKFLEVARTGTAPLEKMLSRISELERENQRLTADLAVAHATIAQQRETAHAGN